MQLDDGAEYDGEGQHDLLPLAQPRFDVSMKTPVALRLTALQSLRRPPGTVM